MEFQNCKYELSMITLYDTGFTTEEKEELKTHIDGYLLMYDVTNKFSTERVKNYMKLILQLLDPHSPLLAEMNKNSWQNVHKKKKESQKQGVTSNTRNSVNVINNGNSPSSTISPSLDSTNHSSTTNSENSMNPQTTMVGGGDMNEISNGQSHTSPHCVCPSSPEQPYVNTTSNHVSSRGSSSSKTPSTTPVVTSPTTATNASLMNGASNNNTAISTMNTSSTTSNSIITNTPTTTTSSTTTSTTILPVIIIGNKCDVSDEEREVDTKEGLKLSDYLGCPLVETSAIFKKKGIENAFIELIKRIDKVRDEKRKSLARTASMASSSVADDSTIDRRKSISAIFSFVSVSTSDHVMDDYQQTKRMRELRKQQLASNSNK